MGEVERMVGKQVTLVRTIAKVSRGEVVAQDGRFVKVRDFLIGTAAWTETSNIVEEPNNRGRMRR